MSTFEASALRLNEAYGNLLSLSDVEDEAATNSAALTLYASFSDFMSQPAISIGALQAKLIELAIWTEQVGPAETGVVRSLADDAIRLLDAAITT